jgi:hypothetical protein
MHGNMNVNKCQHAWSTVLILTTLDSLDYFFTTLTTRLYYLLHTYSERDTSIQPSPTLFVYNLFCYYALVNNEVYNNSIYKTLFALLISQVRHLCPPHAPLYQ